MTAPAFAVGLLCLVLFYAIHFAAAWPLLKKSKEEGLDHLPHPRPVDLS